MKKYILSIDAGTTSSRALVIDHQGVIVSKAQFEFTQFYPQPGWVEHDAIEIWETQKKAIVQALKEGGISPGDIAGIGITNQRETTVVWNRTTGLPVANAIVWQDRRTSERCDKLKADGVTDVFKKKTGLLLDAYFSGTKLEWILNDQNLRQQAENGELAFGTIDTWLIWNLSGGKDHVTDPSNASRTLLYNIHTLSWDAELMSILSIPKSLLPEVKDSSGNLARTNLDVFGAEVPISGIAGDQQAALFGQLCVEPGMVKNTYGTGCFVVMNTGNVAIDSKNGLLTTIGWKIGKEVSYALEGSIFVAGALIQWLRDELKIIDSAMEVEELASSVPDNGGVTIIPAFTGLGTPYWDQYARGAILGLTRGSGRGHIARAALEAIALRTMDVVSVMNSDSGIPVKELRVDGGASKNNLLLQIQANLLNTRIVRPKEVETTALGAAFLAGLGCGFWKNLDELSSVWSADKKFQPDNSTNIEPIKLNWTKGIKATAGWALP